MNTLTITPKTKIYDLLEAYPQLEDVLIELVPTFSKLKNPILRKTIARVTTLQQAALVGNISIDLLINKLRGFIGTDAIESNFETGKTDNSKPNWLIESNITNRLDARPMIERGEHPVELVGRECRALKNSEIFELTTAFFPAPLIDMMKNIGLEAWTDENQKLVFKTYFYKNK